MGRRLPHHQLRGHARPGGIRAQVGSRRRFRQRTPHRHMLACAPFVTDQSSTHCLLLPFPSLLPCPPHPHPPNPPRRALCSVPKRRPMDETQETLRTSAFPSTHVKEKWAKNLYIAGVAYGRTVS